MKRLFVPLLGAAGLRLSQSGRADAPPSQLIAVLMMGHLPQALPGDPPKITARFYNLVYQSLQ